MQKLSTWLRVPTFWIDIVLVGLLGSFGILFRSLLARNYMRLEAGDTFNFLYASDSLYSWTYPEMEKRPPLYPFLIALVRFFHEDQLEVAQYVVVVSGVIAIICLYLIGRHFKISRLALFSTLSLAIFDPLLSLYGVRPLSQGVFFAVLTITVLLVLKVTPSWRRITLLGLSLTALALTRQEGIIVAAALWGSLFIRISPKYVFRTLLISILALSPWLTVVTRTTGSPFRFPGSAEYVQEFTDGERGTTDPRVVLAGIAEISRDTWDTAWRSPILSLDAQVRKQDISNASIAAFSMGLLAVLGLFWMLIRHPRDMVVMFGAFALVVLIAAWYRASGKYASPFISTWYLCAAAGLTAVARLVANIRQLAHMQFISAILIYFGAGVLLLGNLAPALAQQSTGYVLAENGNRWAEVKTTRYAQTLNANILIPKFGLMSRSYLGRGGKSAEGLGRAFLPEEIEDLSLSEQVRYLDTYHISYVVEGNEPRFVSLIDYLKIHNRLVHNRLFVSYYNADEDGTIIRVYRLVP